MVTHFYRIFEQGSNSTYGARVPIGEWSLQSNVLVLCVNILRLDCRNLLSHKTANSLDFSGYFIILMMLIRNWIVGGSDALSDSWNYSLDWITILLFGFLLQFVGKIVRRAVKLKEEQDLTI